MYGMISKDALERLRQKYPPGTRIELVRMNDPYNTKLQPGALGTVTIIDDTGTVHVNWDCGSSLGVCYGEDYAVKIVM